MAVETPLCNFGWQAIDFRLRGTDDRVYSLADVRGAKGTLVMFICNHCPYVRAVISRIVRDVRALQASGIGAIAIMANDTIQYPEDSFANMKIFAHQHNIPFPYVIDETQETARAYGAVCTPEFFGFNQEMKLQYRGRLDASRKEEGPLDLRRDLFEAMRAIAETGCGPHEQFPSMGCAIKWLA
ncbi:Alkyl hydroperoxide reductase and/or thiol-specific antioxidant family (AhpC/TSA) protein [invertebrate metagenome]|uniref:Alkyl hydroperoxide reductase and/or thiol-specific antioxidant family (AhpC/TSA) protein n=1 Tax=invertebrate metagenome TaxID=1711999 RepID=A0A484H7X5_9ZZZZ